MFFREKIRGDPSNFRLAQRGHESTYPARFKSYFVKLIITQKHSTDSQENAYIDTKVEDSKIFFSAFYHNGAEAISTLCNNVKSHDAVLMGEGFMGGVLPPFTIFFDF